MTRSNTKGTAALLASVQGIVASGDLNELAGAVAQLAQEGVASAAALVLLRGEQGNYRGGSTSTPADLETWAEELLREATLGGVVSSRGKLAAPIQGRAVGLHGVVAVYEPSLADDETRAALAEIGRLASSCVLQLVSRGSDSGGLTETRAALAKGLHDLRTPLNSLRLGMHLLGPGLANQDQAVVERTHRAIDRMAALVTEMFDSLQKPGAH